MENGVITIINVDGEEFTFNKLNKRLFELNNSVITNKVFGKFKAE